MNRPTRAEAIEAWSDGSLTPAQRQVLDRAWQEDPAGVRAELRLVLLLRQTAPDRAERSWRALEQALAGTGSGDALARAVDARLHPRSRILLWAGLAAAAVLALIIGGAWYMHRLAPAPPAGPMTIVGIIGPARLDGVELTVTPAVWPAGATLQCAPGTTVRIEGSDGVALELLSATARRHPRTGDDLVLLDGLMHALVKPRTHASALRLHTPHARAEVLGTAFTLRSGETASALRVHRGTVAFSAATGDAATLVAHREAATIGADGSLSRRSLPLLDPRFGGVFHRAAARRYAEGAFLLDATERDRGLPLLQDEAGDAVAGQVDDPAAHPLADARATRIAPDASGTASARLCFDPQEHTRLRITCVFRLERRRTASDYVVSSGPVFSPRPAPALAPVRRPSPAINDEDWHRATVDLLAVGTTADGIPIREALIRLDGRVIVHTWTASLGAVLELVSIGNPLVIGRTTVTGETAGALPP